MSTESSAPAGAVRVRDIMNREVVTVRPDTTVRDLVRVFAERQIGGAPVLGDRGELVGIVTSTDLVRLAADAAEVPITSLFQQVAPAVKTDETDGLLSFLASDAWGDAESLAPVGGAGAGAASVDYEEFCVRDIMRPPRCSVAPDDLLSELANALLAARVHRAPVLESDRLVGIVTTFDVLRAVAGGAVSDRAPDAS